MFALQQDVFSTSISDVLLFVVLTNWDVKSTVNTNNLMTPPGDCTYFRIINGFPGNTLSLPLSLDNSCPISLVLN